MTQITAAEAMLNVLEKWGVQQIYGIPGGSINSLMDALFERRKTIQYIQVRHEESGALAASAHAKLSGHIGVCFGSAGPGATHLMNGLYDAAMDHAPVLALIGQVAASAMNTDTFQELNENPMFADVSVYNRTVMTPESLPHVVDEAVRRAYEHHGIAVVTLPVDFGFVPIEPVFDGNAASHREGVVMPDEKAVVQAVPFLTNSKRPVLYIGRGAFSAADEALALARHFAMPIVSSVPAKGLLPDSTPELMGTAARVASKPANEALAMADLILFVGSDFPFAPFFFPKDCAFVQIDTDASKLGKRHKADAVILGDAKAALSLLKKYLPPRAPTPFLKACLKNRENWQKWIKGFEDSKTIPLRPEPVFREINKIAAADAVFVTDVGNCTIYAVRMLDMNGSGQQFTTSAWFATMGYGLPGGIAAKLTYPDRQVITLNGDGAFSMVMQEVMTQAKYHLPIINVVFSNSALGFIDAEQEVTNRHFYGVDLYDADYAAAAEAMGAMGIKVTHPEELPAAFQAARKSTKPVVMDVKIDNKRPFPAEAMVLDPKRFSSAAIQAFAERYEAHMPSLAELLAES